MDYDPTIVCDYVTLWIKDADNNPASKFSDDRAVWDIPPQAYYYKDRGSVCLMSVADVVWEKGGDNVMIFTQSGFNGSCADAGAGVINTETMTQEDYRDFALLGNIVKKIYDNSDDTYRMEYNNSHEPIRVLTPARPSQIKLYFVEEQKDHLNIDDSIGCITLKFEYINPKILQSNIYSTEYKPAF